MPKESSACCVRKLYNETLTSDEIELLRKALKAIPNQKWKSILGFTEIGAIVICGSPDIPFLALAKLSSGEEWPFFAYNIKDNALLSQLDKKQWAQFIKAIPDEQPGKKLLQCFALDSMNAIDMTRTAILDSPPPHSKKKGKAITEDTADQPITEQPIINQTRTHRGQLFFHIHQDDSSYRYMADKMPTWKARGVTIFFTEMPARRNRFLFKIFNQTGDIKLLRRHLSLVNYTYEGWLEGFITMAQAAYKNGIELIAIDDESYQQTSTSRAPETEQRIRQGDAIMAWHANQCLQNTPTGKFVGLFGVGHCALTTMIRRCAPATFIISEQFMAPDANPEVRQTCLKYAKATQLFQIPNLVEQTPAAKAGTSATERDPYTGQTTQDDANQSQQKPPYRVSDLCRKYGWCAVAITTAAVVTAAATILPELFEPSGP